MENDDDASDKWETLFQAAAPQLFISIGTRSTSSKQQRIHRRNRNNTIGGNSSLHLTAVCHPLFLSHSAIEIVHFFVSRFCYVTQFNFLYITFAHKGHIHRERMKTLAALERMKHCHSIEKKRGEEYLRKIEKKRIGIGIGIGIDRIELELNKMTVNGKQ